MISDRTMMAKVCTMAIDSSLYSLRSTLRPHLRKWVPGLGDSSDMAPDHQALDGVIQTGGSEVGATDATPVLAKVLAPDVGLGRAEQACPLLLSLLHLVGHLMRRISSAMTPVAPRALRRDPSRSRPFSA